MANNSRIRFYATFRNTPELLSLYRSGDLDGLTRFTIRLLRASQDHRPDATEYPDRRPGAAEYPASAQSDRTSPEAPPFFENLKTVSAPSLNWRAAFVSPRAGATRSASVVAHDVTPDELIVAYELASADEARAFLRIANENRNLPLDEAGNAFVGAGFDPGGSVADHWCPGLANRAIFGHRDHARRTVRAHALTSNALLGQHVNVVIIDEGLDKAQIPPENWGGGLDHFIDMDLVQPAGTAPHTSHGMMIARSILDLAPRARLYDMPVMPPVSLPAIPVFVSSVQAAYASLVQAIQDRRESPHWSGPWVLVNAWGIFDTSTDPTGSYTRNTEPFGHPMINLLTRAVLEQNLDIIFAAGNCGQFCPSLRCGGRDRGPGHSIWGANAHPLVITVGAVRSDETWVGYSSQGPGPERLEHQKPDLCAPSQFCETYDAASLSSGSSAACAIAAGVVAALRGNPDWDQVSVTPEALKTALTASARKPNGPAGWDNRLGFGIVDAAATIVTLLP